MTDARGQKAAVGKSSVFNELTALTVYTIYIHINEPTFESVGTSGRIKDATAIVIAIARQWGGHFYLPWPKWSLMCGAANGTKKNNAIIMNVQKVHLSVRGAILSDNANSQAKVPIRLNSHNIHNIHNILVLIQHS